VDPETWLTSLSSVEEIGAIMSDLPEKLFTVWKLSYIEDLPLADIASQRQLETKTVSNYSVRARANIGKRLAQLK
jgi:DNA-directed RNA polymerase specialized sigma24 family protein